MSTAGSANGRSTRIVDRSPLFLGRQRQLEDYYASIGKAVEAISWELARNAEEYSSHVAGSTWVRETYQALGVPALWFYFTIWDQHVRLEFIAVPIAFDPPYPPPEDDDDDNPV